MNIFKGDRKDDWGTPQELFNELNQRFKFFIDLAATKKNTKCKLFYKDSLVRTWPKKRVGWLNPPFSKAEQFFEKAKGHKLVAIYKASNLETQLWQDTILPNASWVCFLRGRTNYVVAKGEAKNGVPFNSAIIGYNTPPINMKALGRVWVLKRGTTT